MLHIFEYIYTSLRCAWESGLSGIGLEADRTGTGSSDLLYEGVGDNTFDDYDGDNDVDDNDNDVYIRPSLCVLYIYKE
jgi:hypothetical protein